MRALQELGVPRNGRVLYVWAARLHARFDPGLTVWGVAANRIHTEIFGPGPSLTPGVTASPQRQPHMPAGPPGTGPLVSFARSGLNVRWEPAFQSLLELAEACDIPVRWACRTGVCHTCETGLVAGRVSYRPDPLDAPAVGNVLICCCQPQGESSLMCDEI